MRPAAIDHLTPHRGDMILFHDPGNLWSVCGDCHDTTCKEIERRHPDPEARAAKIAFRLLGLDGRSITPTDRWVDMNG